MSGKDYSIIDFEEKKGIFRILLVMKDGEILNKGQIKKKSGLGNVAYLTTVHLEEMGLLKLLPVKNNPSEKRYQITEKGKEIIKQLININEILSGN
ncbi:MAG: hypothetical protein ACTSXA_00210 [Candidatus Heimdallarchaeota archaeon]